MDLNERRPWSNRVLGQLGDALREGNTPPTSCPDYGDVLGWHIELGAEVQQQIETGSWATRDQLLSTSSARIEPDLLVGSRAKTEDTLVQKLKRQPTLKLNEVQDIAGVRVDADLLLGEQMSLAHEIADHFGAGESAIRDLRDGAHAGYRGVHVWLRLPAGRVEVQIRTVLQSLWANLYEKLADELGREIRYGETINHNERSAHSAEEIAHTLERTREMSVLIAKNEEEWQSIAESDDRYRAQSLGAAAMQRAMMLAAVIVALQKHSGAKIEPLNPKDS